MRTVLLGTFGTLSLGPISFCSGAVTGGGIAPAHMAPTFTNGSNAACFNRRLVGGSVHFVHYKSILASNLLAMNLPQKVDKQIIRKKIIATRQLITPDEAQLAAGSIAKYLLGIIPENTKVAAYCAMRGEVDMRSLLIKLQERGNKTALPVVMQNEKILKFLEVTPDSALIVGKFGTLCPQPHLPEIEPDVVIVPMVGFDDEGHRLGYGGGYYDATLASLRNRNKKLLVIGVAYAMQRVENIDAEPHDQKMDMVVTEEGIIIK